MSSSSIDHKENLQTGEKIKLFQNKQKQIEELNKKKKAALSTQIVARFFY